MERWIVILVASLMIGLGTPASSAPVECIPDWAKKTTTSGTQIGNGEPDSVPPVGCR